MGIVKIKLYKMSNNLLSKIKYVASILRKQIVKIFAQKRIKIVKGKYGLYYLVMPESALDFHIYKNGVFGDWLAQPDSSLFPPDGNVIEIGANVGLITLNLAKRIFPAGNIYAYEPDLENISQLNINVALNKLKNIHIYPVALQDAEECEQIDFYIRRTVDDDEKENRGLSSILDIPLHQKETNKVFASTIDKEVARIKIKKLSLIKVDVEGAEYKVLLGGNSTIKEFLPIIHYEFSVTLDKLLKNGNAIESYNFLDKMGYIQFAIVEEKRLQQIKDPNSIKEDSNIIAFHKSKLPQYI